MQVTKDMRRMFKKAEPESFFNVPPTYFSMGRLVKQVLVVCLFLQLGSQYVGVTNPRGLFFPLGFLVFVVFVIVFGVVQREVVKSSRLLSVKLSERDQRKIKKLVRRKPSSNFHFKEELFVLGFTEKPNWGALKKRYRSLVKKYHPDLNRSKNSRMQFAVIQSAYEILERNKSYFQN